MLVCTSYSGSKSSPSSTPSKSSSSAGRALAAVLGRWGTSPSGSVYEASEYVYMCVCVCACVCVCVCVSYTYIALGELSYQLP